MSVLSKKSYDKLCDGVASALFEMGYKPIGIRRSRHAWGRYYKFKSPVILDEESINEFLLKRHGICQNNKVRTTYKWSVFHAMNDLLDFYRTGTLTKRCNPVISNIPYPGNFENISEEFLQSLKTRLHPKSIEKYARNIKRLTIHLASQGIDDFSDLKPEFITAFITDISSYRSRYMSDILLSTKKLLKHLYLNGYNDKDLSLFVPKASPRPAKPHLPTIWTKDDIENILSCIDVASPTGKRDYAMILLIARLGIRVGDIIRLTFENIKWERNTIEFNQLKTKTPLVLPLFEDVGNAIIDYIKNGRPVTDSNVVFVKHQVPYTAFSENSRLYAVFNQYLNRAGIAVAPDKSRGVHTLRHTLAVDLLQKEVPLPVISQVLGHQSVNSTSAYLRVDVEQLRQLTIGGEVEYAAQG